LSTTTNKKLFVGNLPKNFTEKELHKIFSKAGKVLDAKLMKRRYTNINQGFAYVTMATQSAARKAVKTLHNLIIEDKKLTVYEAKIEKEN